MQDAQFGASLDRLERRYCRIYPAALLLRYFTQVWVGGSLFMAVGFYAALTITSEIVASGGSIIIAFGLTVLIGLLPPTAFISWVVLVWLISDRFGSRAGTFAAFVALVGTAPLLLVNAMLWGWTSPSVVYALLFSASYLGLVIILVGSDYLVSSLQKGGGVFLLLLALISLLSNIVVVGSILPAFSRDFGTLPADISILGFTLLMIVLDCYPTFILWRAAFGIFAADSRQRLVLPDGRSGNTFWSNLLGRLLGLPSTFEIIRRPRRRFAAIVVLSFIRAASMITGVTFVLGTPGVWARFLQPCFSSILADRELSCPMPLSALHAGLFSVVPIALASIFLAIGWAAQRGQQRLARLSLRALQKVDHRAPVLFLRAFRDDQVQLAPARFGVLGGWLSLPQRRTSLDEILLEEGTIYGPVVALGNPTDRQPPYGAARAYLDNKVWQEVVADLASNSVAIVICVDNTDSIWWEVQHLADKGYLKKTLFLFHPRLIRNSADTEVAVRVLEAMGFGSGATELRSQSASPVKNESPGSTIFGVFIDSNGALQIARSSTFSRVAALITVRWFLRSRFGSNPVAL